MVVALRAVLEHGAHFVLSSLHPSFYPVEYVVSSDPGLPDRIFTDGVPSFVQPHVCRALRRWTVVHFLLVRATSLRNGFDFVPRC